MWAQQRPLGAIVICLVWTNKTSNSIPSVIKGYLDRNINISLKLNQMLQHDGAQDPETGEGDRKTREALYTGKWVSTEVSALWYVCSSDPCDPSGAGGYPWGDRGSNLFLCRLTHGPLKRPLLSHCTHRRGGLTTAHIKLSGWLLKPDPPS